MTIAFVEWGAYVFAALSAIYYILFGYSWHYMLECAETVGTKVEVEPTDIDTTTKRKKTCPHAGFLLCVSACSVGGEGG